MRGFTPQIRVTVDGRDVSGTFYQRLIKASVTDEEGQAVDKCTLDFDDRGGVIALPRKGDTLAVELGFRETGIGLVGEFKVERWRWRMSTSEGETLTIEATGADLTTRLKSAGREAFEGRTFGEIARTIAARDGLEARIDPELAAIRIAYRARIDQSEIDFLTRLADELGGIVKPTGRTITIAKRDAGRTVSGRALEDIAIRPSDVVEAEGGSNPRPRYGSVAAGYTDPATGARRLERAETGFDGPAFVLKAPSADREQARKTAEAEAARLTRSTGDFSFTLYGRPTARAGAKVVTSGFRDGVNGEWRASRIEHVFTPEEGYLTTIEVKGKDRSDGK